MKQRINFYEKGFQALTPLFGFGKYLSKCRIERNLLHLIEFRISQINGCAYCLDMHSKDLRAEGETEQRIYMLDAWKEASIYTAREKAAFRWAEAVTLLKDKEVSDEVYDEAVSQFSDEELIDLTIAVLAINCYNRLNVAFRTPAGDYQPGQHAALNS
ncbi:MAG: carboxymuconolactone decarboxylase family protein [Flavipsychrobacter sp.]